MPTECPQCHVTTGRTDTECKSCGILFEKWSQRAENMAQGDLSRYHQRIANATSSEFNWMILVIFCATVIAGIFLVSHVGS